MADGFYKEICKLLKKAGYKYLENAKGSHEKWACQETGKIMLVPKLLKSRHTANGICKDIGIGKKF